MIHTGRLTLRTLYAGNALLVSCWGVSISENFSVVSTQLLVGWQVLFRGAYYDVLVLIFRRIPEIRSRRWWQLAKSPGCVFLDCTSTSRILPLGNDVESRICEIGGRESRRENLIAVSLRPRPSSCLQLGRSPLSRKIVSTRYFRYPSRPGAFSRGGGTSGAPTGDVHNYSVFLACGIALAHPSSTNISTSRHGKMQGT